MPDITPPSLEDLLRAQIATLQSCQDVLHQCVETSCKVLEQVRAPLVDPTVPPPVEVPWIQIESDGGMTAWRPIPVLTPEPQTVVENRMINPNDGPIPPNSTIVTRLPAMTDADKEVLSFLNGPGPQPPVFGFPDPGPVMPGEQLDQMVTDPTQFREGEFAEAANPSQNDPRTPVVDFGTLPEGTHPVPQGIRYDGDSAFNQGHTAVIRYE